MGISRTTVTEMYERARIAAEIAGKGKEDRIMKIAVTYEKGNVFPHFGHTEQFKVYEIKDGKVAGTQTALAEAGIRFYGGVSGSADEAVEALLAGKLAFDPDVHCNHHGHGHRGEGHHHGNGHCEEDKHGCLGNGGGC